MSRPKISVIIPVYNNGPSALLIAEEALESFPDLEVIMVNDGAPDPSLNNIEDRRFFVYDHPHGGPASARNFGLEKARGKYVVFLDADDSITPTFLWALHDVQEKQRPTLAYTALRQEYASGKKSIFHYVAPILDRLPGESSSDYVLRLLVEDGRLYPVVNKIFRRDLIETYSLRFNESLPLGEDLDFVLNYLKAALLDDPDLRLAFVNGDWYTYHYAHEKSTMKSAAKSWKNWKKSYSALRLWADGRPTGKIYLRWRGSWLKHKLGLN